MSGSLNVWILVEEFLIFRPQWKPQWFRLLVAFIMKLVITYQSCLQMSSDVCTWKSDAIWQLVKLDLMCIIVGDFHYA
jgi:hypothetical protein